MEIVKTKNLKKYYKMDNYTVKAVDNINLNINNHEFIAIVGSSGSGKSTLLNLLGGLDKPTSGKVFINNIDITSMDEDELAIFRRRNIGFIFQNYNLIGNLTVLENITLPIELDGNEIPYDFINEILHVLKLEDKKIYIPINYQVVNSNVLLSLERWQQDHLLFLQTSPLEILTQKLLRKL